MGRNLDRKVVNLSYRIGSPPNQNGNEKTRITWIDWAKAIGIFLVVTGHSNHNCTDIVPMIFMIHMPLFFVVSGYLFNTEISIKDLTKRNIYGLIIPYLIYNVIISIYWLLLGSIKTIEGQPYDWESCVFIPTLNTILGYSIGTFDGPTWFLLALVWCKYFCWLIHQCRWPIKVLTILVWMIMLYFRHQTSQSFFYAFDCGMAGFIWFEIGYLSKRLVRVKSIPRWFYAVSVILGGMLCYFVYRQIGMCNYILSRTNGLLGILGTGAGLIAFFSLCLSLNGTSLKIVTMISKASIVVMCLHMPVQSIVQAIFRYQGCEVLTFCVDFIIMMSLVSFSPFLKKFVPVLLGGR